MSSGDIQSLHGLLRVAEKNLKQAYDDLHKQTVHQPETRGIVLGVHGTILALQQTITTLHRVLDDL